MAGFSCFPALLPQLSHEWGLSGTEAGWVGGVFYAGYTAAVPFLTSLTDRVDPRRVYLGATALGGVAWLGFSLLAGGFWTAMPFQALGGIGLAGTYMPGLKALTDRVEGPSQSRAVAFYTSSFGVGASVSFVLAGQIGGAFGWRTAFAAALVGSLVAIAIAATILDRRSPSEDGVRHTRLLDFRPIFRNRKVMARVIAYAAHNWELFGVRSWIVAFLTFSQSRHAEFSAILSPTVVAAAMTLVGIPGSIGGNEIALRFGRLRAILCAMGLSGAISCIIGFGVSWPFGALVALCLVYGGAISGESAALTSSVVAEADPALRGATMALYSTIGFLGAFLGPLIFGAVLDIAGWGFAFLTLGTVVISGAAALLLLSPRPR